MSTLFRAIVLRGKKRFAQKTQDLRLGTHISCQITIEDPIAAEHHLSIRFDRGQFWIHPQPSSVGTFVDGNLAEGPVNLEVGSEVVVGFCKLLCTQIDDSIPEIQFNANEKAFFYKAKVRNEFESDSDQWVRSEVAFGRFRSLRAANGIMVGLVVLALLGVFFTTRGVSKLFQPEANLHAQFDHFGIDMPAGAEHLENHADSIQCSLCHTEDRSVPMHSCVQCHEDKAGPEALTGVMLAHPFRWEVDSNENHCLDCHVEHGGPPMVLKGKGRLFQGSHTMNCNTCHNDQTSETNEAFLLATWAQYLDAPIETELGWGARERSLPFGKFNHEQPGHNAASTECMTCHVPQKGPGSPVDFASVRYEQCAQCHLTDGPLATDFPTANQKFAFAVSTEKHKNIGDACTKCHSTAFQPDLKQTGRPLEKFLFQFPTYDHKTEWEHTRGKACIECHANPPANGIHTQPNPARAFDHGKHVLSIGTMHTFEAGLPARPVTREDQKQQCLSCHGNIFGQKKLSSESISPAIPKADACIVCHKGIDPITAFESLMVKVPSPNAGERRPQFSHKAHERSMSNCTECHQGEASLPGQPFTLNTTVSCRKCHLTPSSSPMLSHTGNEMGSCADCHDQGTQDRLDPVFYAQSVESKVERTMPGFSHFATGHRFDEIHHCSQCHTPRNGIMGIPKNSNNQSCVTCHATRRFHWR